MEEILRVHSDSCYLLVTWNGYEEFPSVYYVVRIWVQG
jgi:hypothetical protein